jgi:SAM-dependent methyltransferase
MNNTNDQQVSYAQRIGDELQIFNSCSKIHDLPPIASYWSRKFLSPLLLEHGFQEVQEFFAKFLQQAAAGRGRPLFASLGAGDCHVEVQTARLLKNRGMSEFTIECLELSSQLLNRGRAWATEAGVEAHLAFVETDVNSWTADKQYMAIVASHSLHHVLQLEHVLDEVRRALHPAGYFVVTDMIGRNGHMRWPEALEEMRPFWYELPREYRWNHLLTRFEEEYINHDCSTHGFEGIRAQDILPLLIERFDFQFFLAFSNLTDVFVDRGFGPNFDSDEEWDRDFIDRVNAYDEQAILCGRLTPTHMYAVMTPEPSEEHFYSRGLTPDRCVHRERPSKTARGRLEIETCVLRPIENSGLVYDLQLRARGGRGPYIWSATDLPPGLRLTMEGRLTGAIEADGVFTPIIAAEDRSNPSTVATQRYTIIVKPAELIMPLDVISPRILANGCAGGEYAEALLAIGGSAPLHWEIESGTMPKGLVLGAQSGEIRGMATGNSRNSFSVKVTDAARTTVTSQHEITIETSSVNTMKRAGVLPHIAAGSAWQGAIHLINTGKTPIETSLNFYSSSGRRKYWVLKSEVKFGSEYGHFRLAPHATLRVNLAPGTGEEISGWVEIMATGTIGAHAELLYTAPSGAWSQVTIPMVRAEQLMLQLAFDNSAWNRTGMALLNVPATGEPPLTSHPQGMVSVVRDELGRWIETRQFALRPGRHKAFMLADEIPATVGRRGTIEIRAPGPIGGVSLRISAQEIFVLLPPI